MKQTGVAMTVVVLWGLAGAAGVAAATSVCPGERWEDVAPGEVGLDEGRLARAREYALAGSGAGLVVRRGKVAMRWGDTKQRFDLKSTTKSFGAVMLGVAVGEGKVRLGDKAVDVWAGFGVPPGENEGWKGEVTVFQLATQTAGFEKPGGYGRLLFRPGTRWHYSDGGPNWLADCLTHVYGRDLDEVMFEKVLGPIGVTRADLVWREHQYREKTLGGVKRREFGSGIHANVEAMARVGLLHLRGGRWGEKQVLPAEFVATVGKTPGEVEGLEEWETRGEHGDASRHYGLLWWNNSDGAMEGRGAGGDGLRGKSAREGGARGAPRDAYWAWGLHDSLIVVVPSLDLVVARAGRGWKREEGAGHYEVLRPFVGEICGAVVGEEGSGRGGRWMGNGWEMCGLRRG